MKEPVVVGNKIRKQFTGKEFDEDGATGDDDNGMNLYYFGARYYDPDIAMWTSPDPKDQFWNSYSYCGGNPINLIDPDGLASTDADKKEDKDTKPAKKAKEEQKKSEDNKNAQNLDAKSKKDSKDSRDKAKDKDESGIKEQIVEGLLEKDPGLADNPKLLDKIANEMLAGVTKKDKAKIAFHSLGGKKALKRAKEKLGNRLKDEVKIKNPALWQTYVRDKAVRDSITAAAQKDANRK